MPRVTQRAAGLRLEPRSPDTQLGVNEDCVRFFGDFRALLDSVNDSACFLPLYPIVGAHTVCEEREMAVLRM